MIDTIREAYACFYHDFDRSAVQVRQGKLNYSLKGVLIRGGIVLVGFGSGLYGYQISNQKYDAETALYTIGFGTLGMFIAHEVAVLPLIMKRWNFHAEYNAALKQINSYLEDSSLTAIDTEYRSFIFTEIKNISEIKRNSLSQTLGEKARKMKDLLAQIENRLEITEITGGEKSR